MPVRRVDMRTTWSQSPPMPSVQTPKTQPCAIPSSLTAPAGRYHTIQKVYYRSCQSEKQTGKLGQRLTAGPASTRGSQTSDRLLTHRPLPLSQCPLYTHYFWSLLPSSSLCPAPQVGRDSLLDQKSPQLPELQVTETRRPKRKQTPRNRTPIQQTQKSVPRLIIIPNSDS